MIFFSFVKSRALVTIDWWYSQIKVALPLSVSVWRGSNNSTSAGREKKRKIHTYTHDIVKAQVNGDTNNPTFRLNHSIADAFSLSLFLWVFPLLFFSFRICPPLQYLSKVYYVVSLLLLPQRICTSYPPKWKIDRIKGVVISHICIIRIQTQTRQRKKAKKIPLFGVLYRFVFLLYVCINSFNVFIVFFLADAWELYDVLSLNCNGEILFPIQIKLIIVRIQSFEYRFNQFDYFVL